MYIHNITFSVENALADEFITFINDDFIPASLECAGIGKPQLARVLHQVDDKTTNYALQFAADSVDDINCWYEDRGAALFSKIMERWPERILFFQTALQVMS
ncbi:MAG: DUF4286 family protein [Muribaculaceae bacterium]